MALCVVPSTRRRPSFFILPPSSFAFRGAACLFAGMKRTSHRGLYCPELLEARIAPATFVVKNLSDAAIDSLRNLIGVANASPGPDTITFDPALFPGNLPGKITVSLDINIMDTLTIKGPGIDLLTVSGNDATRIFNIGDGTAALKPTTISGLTLTDGKTAGDGGAIFSTEPLTLNNVVIRSSYALSRGGGVFVATPGKVSIVNSRIVHNGVGDGGGGLYLRAAGGSSVVKTTIADNSARHGGGLYASAEGPKGSVLIDTCNISNNTARAGNGGGLQFLGVNQAKLVIKNSLITGNSATGAGGGLYLAKSSAVISKTTFSNNSAGRGGALADDRGLSLTVSGSRFVANRATDAGDAGGGALYLQGLSTVLKIATTIFAGNRAVTDGGAITHQGSLTMSITASSFLGNIADGNFGGAIDAAGTGTLTVTGTNFTGNAGGSGGAFFLAPGTALTMKSSTVSGNAAALGGAISAAGTVLLNLSGNKLIENRASLYGGAINLSGIMGGTAPTANLSGNLFQANVAENSGGAIATNSGTVFTSKSDKFIGNVAVTGQGGGVFLRNTAGIIITGSLFQSNVAGSSGGGLSIGAGALLSGLKVLDNIAGPGGRGGGLRISPGGAMVFLLKSIITGNVANDGGGVFFNTGTTTIDDATIAKTTGNAAVINPNIGNA